MSKYIVLGIVILIIAAFVRKYYRIFTGKGSACSCGQEDINPLSGNCGSGCGCGCAMPPREDLKKTSTKKD